MRQLCTEALRSWYAALSPHRRRTDPNTNPHTHANRSPTLILTLTLTLTLALTLALSLSLALTRYDAALLEQMHPLGRFSPEELALAREGVTSGQEAEGLEHFCGDLSAGYTPWIGGGSAAAEAETGEAAAGAAGGIASGEAAAAEQQADTRPLPPIGGAKPARLPRVASWRDVSPASWRDVLEIGSSSSSRLRELGEG